MNPVLARYEERVRSAGTMVCVGLDSDMAKLPERFRGIPQPQFEFNRWVVGQTREYVAAYKINTAFYEARGVAGIDEMMETAAWLKAECPESITICDAKRADIGNTNRGYVKAFFEEMEFDAVTLHPYLGCEALKPFLEREDKLNIVLCRTSNPGAGDMQDLVVEGEPLWRRVARKVATEWNSRGNCALVVGATWPEEMRVIREAAPDLTFLVPGVGAQGGDVEAVVKSGVDARGLGLMISSSRGVIFDANPGEAAKKLRDEIEAARGAK